MANLTNASVQALLEPWGRFPKGGNEACKQRADVGTLENCVEYFDRRVLEGIYQDKERDEEVALDNTEQNKSGCEPKSMEKAQGKPKQIRLKVWYTSST